MPAAKKSTSGKKSSSGKKRKSSSSKKTTTESVAPVTESVAPVSEPVAPVSEPVAPATESLVSEVSPLESIESEFASLTSRLLELKTLQMSITTDLKRLHKSVQKHIKESGKKKNRKKMEDPNRPKRAPSGFAKPSLISNELCKFLNKPLGTEMARTEVTKFLTEYIKENQLQDQSNRRKIVPDKSLQKLLNVSSKDEVTYFNLQKYMKVHFPKSASQLSA